MVGYQKFSVFNQFFLLSENWALLLHISVGAEGPFLSIVENLSNFHTWKLFPVLVKGHLIVNPGSSHVCFLGSMCNSLTYFGKGSLSSRIDLPVGKPVSLLLLITWEICREEPVFGRGGWHQRGNAIAPEEFNKLQCCHGQSSSLLLCQPSGPCLQGAPPYAVAKPSAISGSSRRPCLLSVVSQHKWHS